MPASLVDPERELALSYARTDVRGHLHVLWRLDEKFGAIVSRTTDVTIGEMRLLWWREALSQLADTVPSEPLLQDIGLTLAALNADGAQWGAMAEGWHVLLQQPWDEDDLCRYSIERGGRLFLLSAEILGAKPDWVEPMGRAWSLVDLAHRVNDSIQSDAARSMAEQLFSEHIIFACPAMLRPLGALLVLARRDIRIARRRQGSPARVSRMLWHRLTGR